MANEVLRIGEMAQRSSTKVETIRYYERIGLLATPVRTQGNYRVYSNWHLRRLKFIRRGRDLGFSLGEVRTLLLRPTKAGYIWLGLKISTPVRSSATRWGHG